jgi:hypothetical protein
MVSYDMLELNQILKRRDVLRDRILTFIKSSDEDKQKSLTQNERRSIKTNKLHKYDDPKLIEVARKIINPEFPKEMYQ